MQPVTAGENSRDAKVFVLPETGPNASTPVYLSEDLTEASEDGDYRKSDWVGNSNYCGTTYYYPYKYTNCASSDPNTSITEYCTVMRLAEQFLIRSEARAEQGKLDEAISDVDKIRMRGRVDFN